MKSTFTLLFVSLFGFLPFTGHAQYITISGYISDFLTGDIIENATVFERSSGIGTISDQDGFYKLTLKPGQMDISFINNGFESFSQKFTVAADTTMMIQLKPERWNKDQRKGESDLHSGLQGKKNSHSKKLWFF